MPIKSLPDIRQKTGHDCGHAAAKCVAVFHATGDAIHDLATEQHGTDPATLEAIFRKAGWWASAGERSLSELAYYCGDSRPVICAIQRHGGGHYVVVRAVTRSRVWFHCPIDGDSWLTHREWLAAWNDNGRYSEFQRFGLVVFPKPKH
jgi:ABC-type bacteriocin/lantibiotic exporter with double-glycine peptidase domain